MTSNTATQGRLLLQPFMFGDLELPNRIEVIPPWVRTELVNSSEEPRAMPLDEFLQGTMDALATDGD